MLAETEAPVSDVQKAIDEAYAQIARKYQLDKDSVIRLARAKTGGKPRSGATSRDVQMMYKAGFTTAQIASHYNVTPSTVLLKLKQDELTARQMYGTSTYEVYNMLPPEHQKAFLAYAAFGEREGLTLTQILALGFIEQVELDQDHKVLSYGENAPIYTAEELDADAYAAQQEDEGEEDSEEEEEAVAVKAQAPQAAAAPAAPARKSRTVFEQDSE